MRVCLLLITLRQLSTPLNDVKAATIDPTDSYSTNRPILGTTTPRPAAATITKTVAKVTVMTMEMAGDDDTKQQNVVTTRGK